MGGGRSLVEAEIDFSDFASKSPDLLCVARTDGYFYWLSESWEKQLGWTRDELQAAPFIDFVHPDDVAATVAEVGTLEQGNQTLFFVNRYRAKSGEWHWMEWNARPNPNGYIYANCRDVTHYREQLAIAERQLHLLQFAEEVGGVGHWRLDLERDELYWSPQVYRIRGLDPAGFTPTMESSLNTYHPEDRDEARTVTDEAIKHQTPFSFRLRLLRSDGAVRLVHTVGRPEIDEVSGRTRALFGVSHDVTEQEEELRRSNDELRQFAYATSHDLQAPLRSLIGFGGLLKDDEHGLSATGQDYLDRMVSCADRMQQLIAELYNYAAVMKEEGDLEPVALDSVLEEVLEALTAEIDAAEAKVVTSPLPVVLGRRAQLVSLFLNLVANALKFRADRPLEVRIAPEQMGVLVAIHVEDNGVGFDPKHGERVFGLFQRLHQRGAYTGMGVGLALAKRIAENHGGSIRAEATPEQGARFSVTLQSAPGQTGAAS